MMRTRKWKRIGLSVLIVALAAACQSPVDRPPREALEGWLYRTQGLVGVFPPREDVRVGDVHIYLRDPEGADSVSLYAAPRWSYLPSSELLRAGYRLRPEYPPTSADYLKAGVAPAQRAWPESTGKPGFLEPGAAIDRLRSIQLPSFAHYRREDGELPPSWGLHQVLEEGYDDWEVIRVRIEAAETASLALADAVSGYLERRGSSLYLPASLRPNLRALAPDSSPTIWVRIVTEVIYMRAIRVTVVTKSDFELIEDEVSSAQLGDGESDEEGDSEVSDEELDLAYLAIARANAMNREMIESGTDVLPDGFVRFISVSDDTTTARRVYRRAIAIGVGGLSLRVDARTGMVEELRLMGRDLPRSEPMSDESDDEPDYELDDELDDEPGDDRAIDAEPSMPPSGNGNSDEE